MVKSDKAIHLCRCTFAKAGAISLACGVRGAGSQAHTKLRRVDAGMTLMEVLIVVFMLAMIGLVTADTVFRAHRVRENVNQVNDVYHSARVVLDRMVRELATAYIAKPLPGPDQSKIPQTIFKAQEESPINRLLFSSFSHIRLLRDVPESDQNIITYYGKSNPHKSYTYRLFRSVKTYIDGKPEEGGISHELLDNVARLEFRFWDKQKTDWVRDWDTTKIEFSSKLPHTVEIKLTIRDHWGKNIEFLTRTRIFMRELLNR